MLPIPYNHYLVHEQMLALIANILACENVQLGSDVLSIEFSGYFSVDFCWGKIEPHKYFLFDFRLMNSLYRS